MADQEQEKQPEEFFEVQELDDKDLEDVAGGSENEGCTNGSCSGSSNTGGCENTTCGGEEIAV